jgi:hypothetical protein
LSSAAADKGDFTATFCTGMGLNDGGTDDFGEANDSALRSLVSPMRGDSSCFSSSSQVFRLELRGAGGAQDKATSTFNFGVLADVSPSTKGAMFSLSIAFSSTVSMLMARNVASNSSWGLVAANSVGKSNTFFTGVLPVGMST